MITLAAKGVNFHHQRQQQQQTKKFHNRISDKLKSRPRCRTFIALRLISSSLLAVSNSFTSHKLFLLFNIQNKNALCLLQQVFFVVVRLTGPKMTNLIYPPLMIIMSFDVAVQHTDYESWWRLKLPLSWELLVVLSKREESHRVIGISVPLEQSCHEIDPLS